MTKRKKVLCIVLAALLALAIGLAGCGNGSSTDQDIADTNLTSAVGLSVVTCETLNQNTCELVLAV